MRNLIVLLLVAVLVPVLASCDECSKSSDCGAGKACVDGKCQSPGNENDTDTESDTGASQIWCDNVSGLCWQNPPGDPWKAVGATGWTWQEAIDYCDGLSLEDNDDWRSPKIDELRLIIRIGDGTAKPQMPHCSENLPGGACETSDPDCLAGVCVDNCGECLSGGGPGKSGCYWEPALEGTCGFHWSSSEREDLDTQAWGSKITEGMIAPSAKTDRGYVRCVRTSS
ncbi:MAG: DUF1566 domain-containing protein [Deltaproteobacteria bacterium]|nr:DUF1566 domain-containing protein [Deltaproteobacteria bacterium]